MELIYCWKRLNTFSNKVARWKQGYHFKFKIHRREIFVFIAVLQTIYLKTRSVGLVTISDFVEYTRQTKTMSIDTCVPPLSCIVGMLSHIGRDCNAEAVLDVCCFDKKGPESVLADQISGVQQRLGLGQKP